MNVKDLLRYNIEMTHGVTTQYLSDISDDEMFTRAVPGSNHLAWQLGHLIASEHHLLSAVGVSMPDLPAGFAEAHSKETTGSDDPSAFLKKDEYLALMDTMHDAARAAIDASTEEDLDTPSPEGLREWFPNKGSVLLLAGAHEMMHTGQIAAIRRSLGKPVVI